MKESDIPHRTKLREAIMKKAKEVEGTLRDQFKVCAKASLVKFGLISVFRTWLVRYPSHSMRGRHQPMTLTFPSLHTTSTSSRPQGDGHSRPASSASPKPRAIIAVRTRRILSCVSLTVLVSEIRCVVSQSMCDILSFD